MKYNFDLIFVEDSCARLPQHSVGFDELGIAPPAAVADHPSLRPGRFMSLLLEPRSAEAIAFVQDLTRKVHVRMARKKGPTKRLFTAVGAILGDLIQSAADGPTSYSYRCIGSDNFKDCIVKRPLFCDVVDALQDMGLVRSNKGYRPLGRNGSFQASRFQSQPPLTTAFKAAGIDPSDWKEHFGLCDNSASILAPVALKSSSTKRYGSFGPKTPGRRMKVDRDHPTVIKSSAIVYQINQFISLQNIAGCQHHAFQRIFNLGDDPHYNYNKGGALI